MTLQTTLGDLIALVYNEFMEMYGDEELAALATAAVINDMIAGEATTAIEKAA